MIINYTATADLNLPSTLDIAGDLTVDAPNATVNNNAKVSGTVTITDVKSGTWNELVDVNTLVFNAAGKTLNIINGIAGLTINVNATVITPKAVNAVVAKDVEVIVKANAEVSDEDAVKVTGTESTTPVELDPEQEQEPEPEKKYEITFNVTPEDATVVVKKDETVVAAREDGTYELEAGTYSYTVTKEGYKEATGTIEVGTENKTVTVALEKEVDSTVADVKDFNGLKAALGNTTIKTINITADITNIGEALVVNHAVTINGGGKTLSFTSELNELGNGQRQGILVNADGTQINNLSVVMAGDDGWQGVYGIQVYNATEVKLDGVKLQNADAGLLVNGSEVTANNIETSGNEFGGIEVSQGLGVTSQAKLTVTGISKHNENVHIWTVGGKASVEAGDQYKSGKDIRKGKEEFTNYILSSETREVPYTKNEVTQTIDNENKTVSITSTIKPITGFEYIVNGATVEGDPLKYREIKVNFGETVVATYKKTDNKEDASEENGTIVFNENGDFTVDGEEGRNAILSEDGKTLTLTLTDADMAVLAMTEITTLTVLTGEN